MSGELLEIAGRPVGAGQPCLIIAEAGVNHNGDLDRALALIDVAADCGACAVKFQTFSAKRLASRAARTAAYQRQNGAGESQLALLEQLELTADDHQRLAARCRERGVLFLSTPFDEPCADLLHDMSVPAFKIPSGELTNLPFLAHVARFGKPLILSTGMGKLGEVELALEVIREAAAPPVVVLHCVSDYPASPASVNLRAMQTLASAFRVAAGYSDHTLGIEVALAAVALGACVLEQHITLDRRLPGPDHAASLEPEEFAALVRGVRIVESALGDGRKRPTPSEQSTAALVRKSIIAACDIPAGARLSLAMLIVQRPGTGLAPALQPFLLGRVARVAIPAGTPLQWEMVV